MSEKEQKKTNKLKQNEATKAESNLRVEKSSESPKTDDELQSIFEEFKRRAQEDSNNYELEDLFNREEPTYIDVSTIKSKNDTISKSEKISENWIEVAREQKKESDSDIKEVDSYEMGKKQSLSLSDLNKTTPAKVKTPAKVAKEKTKIVKPHVVKNSVTLNIASVEEEKEIKNKIKSTSKTKKPAAPKTTIMSPKNAEEIVTKKVKTTVILQPTSKEKNIAVFDSKLGNVKNYIEDAAYESIIDVKKDEDIQKEQEQKDELAKKKMAKIKNYTTDAEYESVIDVKEDADFEKEIIESNDDIDVFEGMDEETKKLLQSFDFDSVLVFDKDKRKKPRKTKKKTAKKKPAEKKVKKPVKLSKTGKPIKKQKKRTPVSKDVVDNLPKNETVIFTSIASIKTATWEDVVRRKGQHAYHLIPVSNGGWFIKRVGEKNPYAYAPTKELGETIAKEYAKKEKATLKIHNKRGTIIDSISYGRETKKKV